MNQGIVDFPEKRKWTYWLLGIAGGIFGFHNFYRGCLGRGFLQFTLGVAVTVLFGLSILPSLWAVPLFAAVWIWGLGEIMFCCYDAYGCPMR